jgi:hypothetical protein
MIDVAVVLCKYFSNCVPDVPDGQMKKRKK